MSRATVYECDGCGTTVADDRAPVGWWHINVLRVVEHGSELHQIECCSTECMVLKLSQEPSAPYGVDARQGPPR